jgi:hypothetical protein
MYAPNLNYNIGASWFRLFSHFHHFTAEPQRLAQFFQSYSYLYATNMCKMSYKFVKNESYQIFTNICRPNLASLQVFLKNGLKMIVIKLVLPNCGLKVTKM